MTTQPQRAAAGDSIRPSLAVVLTGSVAPFAMEFAELLGERGHTVQIVESDRTEQVPSMFAGSHEIVPAEPLRTVVADADVVLVLTGLGSLSATVDDAAALDAILGATRPGAALVEISSFGIFGDRGDEAIDETATPDPPPGTEPVRAAEIRVLAADDWLRTVVVRPGLVYGPGGGPVVDALVELARRLELSPYVGEAHDSYPLVHVDDLTSLLLRTVEDERAHGVFHAVSDRIDAEGLARLVADLAGVDRVVPFTDEAIKDGTLPGLTSTTAPPRINLRAVSTRGDQIDWAPKGPTLTSEIRGG